MVDLTSKLLTAQFKKLYALFIICNISFLSVEIYFITLKIITFELITSVIFSNIP